MKEHSMSSDERRPGMATTRRRLVRQVAGGGGGVAALAAFAGCGADNQSPVPVSAPVTVTYQSGLAETHPTGAARIKLLEEFNQTNPHKITVDLSEGRAVT